MKSCFRLLYNNIGFSFAPLSVYFLSTESHADSEFIENVQLQRLKDQSVVYKDRHEFERKKAKFIADGPHRFQVVSDFDFTLSKFKLDGKRGFSCHKVIHSILSPENERKAVSLHDYYYPLEVSSSIDSMTKAKFMVEWVDKIHQIILEDDITRIKIRNSVSKSLKERLIGLREGVCDMILLLDSYNIPLLIFSAGIKDVVEEVLQQEIAFIKNVNIPPFSTNGNSLHVEVTGNANISDDKSSNGNYYYWLPSNLHVVSNSMIFSGPEDTAKLTGFEDLVFHILNKKATSILHTPYFELSDLKHRTNMLLIGDSLGDLSMSEGLADDSRTTIIRIGFLNDNAERLPEYLNAFDVVILGDPSADIPYKIIQAILLES